MKGPIRWGLILGGAVAVLNLVSGLAGWHGVYEMTFVFLIIAISLNVITVFFALREQAAFNSWLSQVGTGLVVGAVASLIIFFSAWLVSAVIFPDYFTEMAEGYRQTFIEQGLSEAEVEKQVAATANTSAVQSAFSGVVGTMVTSVLVAAIAGIWLRKKG